ncbi:MAG: hypothetical protein HKN87_10455 [Saprospiraceae bacterium]|nr:hypothetical protein [Saprospiraceae bacterium]
MNIGSIITSSSITTDLANHIIKTTAEELLKRGCQTSHIQHIDASDNDNHPKYVLPFLQADHKELQRQHPGAELWVSLQGFEEEAVEYCFEYLKKELPYWLTGVVYGPSSPAIHLERPSLPPKYKHRLYGDLTHTVRCQYPTLDWDQEYALTLGRELTNPQPSMYADIFDRDMTFTDGFLSYSDGVHNDVNKFVWNIKGWDPSISSVDISKLYASFFFGNRSAIEIADAILALEKNWQGALAGNGAVEGTLLQWQKLAADHPQLHSIQGV